MVYNFTSISMENFAEMVAKNNKDEKKENVIKAIKSVLSDEKKGEKCSCGNPIWVAGSALGGSTRQVHWRGLVSLGVKYGYSNDKIAVVFALAQ